MLQVARGGQELSVRGVLKERYCPPPPTLPENPKHNPHPKPPTLPPLQREETSMADILCQETSELMGHMTV